MLNLIVSGARVSYDSLEEAKDAARESGLGLAFWRETLTECAESDVMWNEFLNDLWQSGAEDEAERLDRTFPRNAPRHWLLVAVTLDGDDPWQAFLAEWEAQGDERILPAVSSHAFAPWMKQVQPKVFSLFILSFGTTSMLKLSDRQDLVLRALKGEAEWPVVAEANKLSITAKLVWQDPVQLDLFAFVLLDSGEEHVISCCDIRDDGNVFLEVGNGVALRGPFENYDSIVCRHLKGIRRILFVVRWHDYSKNVQRVCRTRLCVTSNNPSQSMIVVDSEIPCRISWHVIAKIDNGCGLFQTKLFAVNLTSADRPSAKDAKWQTPCMY